MRNEPHRGTSGKATSRNITVDWHKWGGNMSALPAEWRSTDFFTFSPAGSLVVRTLRGPVTCPVDWFVIHGVGGDFYPVPPAVFHARYEVTS